MISAKKTLKTSKPPVDKKTMIALDRPQFGQNNPKFRYNPILTNCCEPNGSEILEAQNVTVA